MSTPSYRQLPLALSIPAPDQRDPLAAARAALAAADHARDRAERHHATAILADHLVGLAHLRGRTPVLRPGQRAATTLPSRGRGAAPNPCHRPTS